jgi:3,2-trans-enoyl-CoA isomerase
VRESSISTILITDHESVRELRLNRPPANAISPDLITDLIEAVGAAPRDGARAIVLCGAQGMFSAGLDLPLWVTLDRAAVSKAWHAFYDLLRALVCSSIPISAAITGHAPAGGTVLSVFCDWRCMAQGDWKMGFTEVQVGLPLPPIIFAVLKRQVGARQAERLSAGGMLLTPDEALKIGLVDELVRLDRVIERAIEWSSTLLKLPALAMTETRRKARADLAAMFQQDLEPEIANVIASWWTDEAQATLKAVAARLARKKAVEP